MRMNSDLLFNIVISVVFGGLFAYGIYLAAAMRNLRTEKWKHGKGGLYVWDSDKNRVEIFFVPMRKTEIEYAEEHPEEWLEEQDRLWWHIRRVHITWLPWYMLQYPGPDKFCEGLMNYFEKEAVRDDVD